MSDRYDRGRSPDAALTPPPDPTSPAPLTHEQLDRWAELVAAGEADAPDELSPAQQHQLQALVRRRRRARLVAYLARQIALDLHRGQQPRPAEPPATNGDPEHA